MVIRFWLMVVKTWCLYLTLIQFAHSLNYGFMVPRGVYDVVLNTDDKAFGGFGFADDSVRHFTCADPLYAKEKKEWLKLYIPARSAVVLKRAKN